MVDERGGDYDDEDNEIAVRRSSGVLNNSTANYITVAACPSKFPARQFCSVCGYFGQYTCTRCGLRFCSIKCNEHHKETRCLKFSM